MMTNPVLTHMNASQPRACGSARATDSPTGADAPKAAYSHRFGRTGLPLAAIAALLMLVCASAPPVLAERGAEPAAELYARSCTPLPRCAVPRTRPSAPTAPELYASNCMGCHGQSFDSPREGELVRLARRRPGELDMAFARIIGEGDETSGMPAFGASLSREQILGLAALIRGRLLASADPDDDAAPGEGVFRSFEHSFMLETIAEASGTFWSMDFMPDGSALITEKSGALFRYTPGAGRLSAISGTPEVASSGQGGLLDVLAHPGYTDNGWVYLAYADPATGMTSVARGRISEEAWTGSELLFSSEARFDTGTTRHFGTRMVIADGYLYFGIGDRGVRGQAQDPHRPNGKIHRIHDDGRVPEDNPFANGEDGYPTIWTMGNRNPQGLTLRADGGIWEAEHGPRGGDEINLIAGGRNYGWPILSYGVNYNGTPFAEAAEREGYASPLWHWTPSIAPSNLDFYTGDIFLGWRGDLFVGSLAAQELQRLRVRGNNIVSREVVLRDQGRIRDVRSGPDGYLYLLIQDGGRSALKRMRPPVRTETQESPAPAPPASAPSPN